MTETNLQLFDFKGNRVRTLVAEDGEPWFVAKDVCAVLGYQNASKAIIDHVDNEDKLNNESLSSLGQRGGWIINESGLYSLILSSKLDSAKEFRKWVTSEVLPQIRRTGGYIPTSQSDDEKTILAKALEITQRTLNAQQATIRQQTMELETQRPLAALGEAFVATDGTMSVTDAAKHFRTIDQRMSRDMVYGLLRGAGYIESKSNAPTVKAIKPGYLTPRQFVKDGRKVGKPYSRFTTKGANWFIRRFIYGDSQHTLEGVN